MKLRHRKGPDAAFTRTDLVALMFMLVLFALIFAPAYAATKVRSRVAGCLDNQRRLAVAWTAYAVDNRDKSCGMNDALSSDWRVRPGNTAWKTPPPPAPTSARDAVVKWDSWGFQLGALYSYIQDSTVLHCPDDKRVERSTWPVYNSYAGVRGIATFGGPTLSKASQIRNPAERFLWVEASEFRDVSVSGYVIGEVLGAWSPIPSSDILDTNKWPAPPSYQQVTKWYIASAAFHNDSATFSYADGHAASRKWRDPDTFVFFSNPGFYRHDTSLSVSNDVLFVSKGFPSLLNP